MGNVKYVTLAENSPVSDDSPLPAPETCVTHGTPDASNAIRRWREIPAALAGPFTRCDTSIRACYPLDSGQEFATLKPRSAHALARQRVNESEKEAYENLGKSNDSSEPGRRGLLRRDWR